MEVKGPNQTREAKTKVSETAGIKTKVTRTKVLVTRTTKTATKETSALGVTKVVVEGTRGKIPEGVNTTRPNASASSANQQGIYDDDVDSSDIIDIKHSVSCVIASVIAAILPDEFLHDPSTLPSDHLNVTVLVQDKDKERQSSVRRTVGKVILDTANYSEDFVSFTMIDKYA